MQHLNINILEIARKEKIQKLESDLKDIILNHSTGEIFICPLCNYSSEKNKKGSAKVFSNAFKCFHCGIWRGF